MFSDIFVRGKNVTLIPYDRKDTDDLYSAYSDPEVMKYIPEGQMSRQWVENLIDWMVGHCYVNNTPERIEKFGVSIRHNDSDKVIGWCGLGSLDYDITEIELFYGLASKHWGQGYGTEAAQLMLGYGFHVIGLKRIVALVNKENIGSKKIIAKLGMRFETITQVDDPAFQGYDDLEFYSLSREQYLANGNMKVDWL